MPSGLIHNQKAGSTRQSLLKMLKKKVHHGRIDPGREKAEIFTCSRTYRAVHVKIFIARPRTLTTG